MSEIQGLTLNNATRADAPVLTVTLAAQHKIFELIQEEGNLSLKLRIFVTGGGCSGYQYGFTFDEEVYDDDTTVINKITDLPDAAITILIDAACLPLLKGAEVDYKEDLTGSQFIVRNPNASTTCGCGSSFSA